MSFFEDGDLNVFVVLTFERCEHSDDTSIVDGDQESFTDHKVSSSPESI